MNRISKKFTAVSLSLILLLAISGCSSTESIMLLQQGEYSIDKIPDTLLNRADAVTRHYEREIDIISRSEAATMVRFAVTVLDREGRDHGQLVLRYDNFRQIEYVNGSLRDSDGRLIRTLSKDDERDFKATSNISLYDDNRIKVYDLYHGRYPYTIEYEYKIRHNGYIGFPNMTLQGYRESVQHAEIRVLYPVGVDLNHLVENGTPNVDKEVSEGRNILRFTFENLLAMEGEELDPPSSTYIPRVSVSPDQFMIEGTKGSLKSWKEFGRWYYNLSRGRQELPENIKTEIDHLLAGASDDSTRLKLLYNYLQEKTRYVSIQLGLGGWQPFDAAYVSKNRYGDCKALTNFMMALAQYAGIETYPVLINSGVNSLHAVNPDFPSNAFNHIVLMAPVGKDTVWMECTSKTNVFDNIGLPNENRYALVIKKDGGEIVKTPAKAYYENRQINKIQLEIDSSGSAKSVVETSYTGNQQEYIRQLLSMKNDTERERWLRNSTNLNSSTLKESVFSDPAEKSRVYTLSHEMEVPQFATKTGSRLFIPLNAFNQWEFRFPDARERKRNIFIPFSYEDRDSARITIPEGHEVESLPASVHIKTDFIEYESDILAVDKHTLLYNRRLALKKKTIPIDQFEQLKSTLDEIWKSDRQNIVTTEI